MKLFVGVGALLLGTSALCSPLIAAPAASQVSTRSADARLKAIYDDYADWTDKEFGAFENKRGEQERAGYLPHVDEASQLRRAAHMKDVLAQLDAIPATQLSPDEQVNAAVLRTVLQADIADY